MVQYQNEGSFEGRSHGTNTSAHLVSQADGAGLLKNQNSRTSFVFSSHSRDALASKDAASAHAHGDAKGAAPASKLSAAKSTAGPHHRPGPGKPKAPQHKTHAAASQQQPLKYGVCLSACLRSAA